MAVTARGDSRTQETRDDARRVLGGGRSAISVTLARSHPRSSCGTPHRAGPVWPRPRSSPRPYFRCAHTLARRGSSEHRSEKFSIASVNRRSSRRRVPAFAGRTRATAFASEHRQLLRKGQILLNQLGGHGGWTRVPPGAYACNDLRRSGEFSRSRPQGQATRSRTEFSGGTGMPSQGSRDDAEVRAFYEEKARIYRNLGSSVGDRERLVLALFPVTRSLRVLDAGCGSGAFLRILQSLGHDAVGLDISQAAVETVRQTGARAFAGNPETGEGLAAVGSEFDVVTALDFLEHT